MFISGILSLALLPILINMLGKIEYGAFELITSLMIINFLLEFGMGATLLKFIPEYKENRLKLREFIWSYFYIKLLVTFIGIFFVVIIGYYFDNIFQINQITNITDLKFSVYIFALGILLSSISTFFENILKGFIYFAQINIAKISVTILFFLICYSYYSYFDTYSIIHISIIWFVIRPILLIITMLSLLFKLDLFMILIPSKFKIELIKPTFKYLFGMSYISIVAQLYNKLPKVILGIFLGPIYVGYWGVIERVKRPILDIQNAILKPLIPLLSDKKQKKLSREKIFQASRLNSIVISFLAIVVLVNIDMMIHFWIGEDFASVASFIKIIFLPFVAPTSGILLMMYYAEGETKINRNFLTLNTTISLILGTTLLFIYEDLLLFIYAYTFTIIILVFINIFSYLKYFKINANDYIKNVMIPLLLLVIGSFSVSYYLISLIPFTLLGLIINLFITSVIYMIFVLLVMPEEDRIFIKSLILKRRK